ncbi:hypothetical protein EJ04DRAFT_444146 [Polyplosphaeria fusca]|uniref:Rhodopsin domain-containing protein n=1 Tax=Polyplosphaeria fusca TaxID=682080 RepID=A0A9P4QNS3_9PLEO|nr:hypothetical protein EJ04DRAFT_444146 [Polyplosphaeria fusca]
MAPTLTAAQQAIYHEDRRPQLYAALITLLVLVNFFVVARLVAHYYDRYRHEKFGFNIRILLAEDLLIVLSALFVDVMIGNLLAATHFGLGLHSWRINAEDPNYPRNLSNAFRHVWITMVFTPSTFTWIKLTLLFFYRRLFLVSQKWLQIAWWANLVYVVLWLIGATGFYLFQCWPVQWYFMRYYSRYHREPPYPITGQCNATNVTNVSRPLIFGLISDAAILLLPVFSISQLQMSLTKKVGLIGVFSVGVIACGTDMARIIELSTDTDDIIDPACTHLPPPSFPTL